MKRPILVLALCLATANAGGLSPPRGGSGQKGGGRSGSDPWVSAPVQEKGGKGTGRNGGEKQGGGKGQQQDPWLAPTGGRQPAGGPFGVQPEDPWPSTNTGRQGGPQTPRDPWVNGNSGGVGGEQPADPWPASNSGRQGGQTTRDPWVNGNSGNFGGQTTRDPWVNGNSGNFGGQTTKDPRFGGNSGTFGGHTTKDPRNNGKGGLFGGQSTTPDPWILGDLQGNQGTRFPSSAGGQSSKPSSSGSQTQNGYPQEFPASGFPSNTDLTENSGSYPGFPSSSGNNPGFPSNTGVSGNTGSYPGYPSGNTDYSGNKPGYPSSNPGSNPGYPGSNPGYPGSNPGYPGSNPGFPGSPSSNSGYPSSNTGNPNSNTGYPIPNTGYPSPKPGYPSPNVGFPSGNNNGDGRQGSSAQQVDPRCQLSSGTSSCPLLDYAQMYCTKGVQDQQLGQYMTSLFQCVSNKVRVAGSCPSQESAMGRSLFEDAPAENCLFQQGRLCEVAQAVQRFNGAVFGAVSLQDTKGFQNKIISVFTRVLPYCESK